MQTVPAQNSRTAQFSPVFVCKATRAWAPTKRNISKPIIFFKDLLSWDLPADLYTCRSALPVHALPVDALPVAALPVDALPVDALPVDALPVDALPVDALPVDVLPVDVLPVDVLEHAKN